MRVGGRKWEEDFPFCRKLSERESEEEEVDFFLHRQNALMKINIVLMMIDIFLRFFESFRQTPTTLLT